MNIIVIDDDASICRFLETAIAATGHKCHSARSLAEAEILLAEFTPHLALLDLYLKDSSGLDVLRYMRVHQPSCGIVMMTAHASIETVAGSLQHGADEYLGKPIHLEDLRALFLRFEKHQVEDRPEAPAWIPTAIIGNSKAMLEVYRLIARVAPSDVGVLVTGPSGSGKELVARAIHTYSLRSRGPFMGVNCGALPEQILENELFGHERGAFTGADSVTQGLFEACSGGTIFLDEITETSLAFQVKLLRVLQEGEIRRLGSSKTIEVNARVIAATNRPIGAQIISGTFREDLYYRLGVVNISLPPLSDRRDDIPLLAQHFLQKANAGNSRNTFLTSAALQALVDLPWPGNVRELENFMQRLVIFAVTEEISVDDVRIAHLHAGSVLQQPEISGVSLKEVEREQIVRVLNEASGNRSLAARRLGIERKTLYMKAKRLGIDLKL